MSLTNEDSIIESLYKDADNLIVVGQQVIYRLEADHHVEDECDDYEDQQYSVYDTDRPELPIHPNCKCYYEDAETGEDLGQF